MLNVFLKNKNSIFLYSFIFFSIGTFYISFFPPDEPKYVDAALKMIENGNYLVPFFNCHIRFDKPILFYWEIALFFKIFGVEHLLRAGNDIFGLIEFSARLPAVFSAALSAVYTYLLSLELFKSENIAKYSVLGFISTGFFMYLGRSVYPDMSLILFELMGVYYFIKNRYCIGWFFTALAFLTKGPIGIISVGLTYFLYLWTVKHSSGFSEFFSFKNLMGFFIFLVIGAPWYFMVYQMYGMEFVNKFLLYHNIERFTGVAHQHPHSFFYYFPIVPLVLYIWWPYIIDMIVHLGIKDRKILFLIYWFLWVFVFFSISKNKLAHYIAFGFVPLSIIFGATIEKAIHTLKKGVSFAFLELILGIFLSFLAYKRGMIAIVPSIFAGFIIVALTNLLKKPVSVVFYKTAALAVVAFIVLLQFEGYRPEKFVWHEVLKTHLQLVQYRKFNQSLVAYTRCCMKEVKKPKIIENKKGSFLVYTKTRHLKELNVRYKILGKFIDKGTKTVLIKVTNE